MSSPPHSAQQPAQSAPAGPFGLGTDVVALTRIARIHQRFGARFVQRLLHPSEVPGIPLAPAAWQAFLARRWAVKEAAAKALGTGIGRHLSFTQLVVSHTAHGAPQLTCTRAPWQHWQFTLSVSDDAVANVALAVVLAMPPPVAS